MPNRRSVAFGLLLAVLISADAAAQYVLVSPARGVNVCNAASQRIIRVAPESLTNGVLQLLVTKTNAQCTAGGFFGNPDRQEGGRIDVHESSINGPVVASVNYAYNDPDVRVQVRPTFETTYRDYYVVVGSDPNRYWDGPVQVRSFDLARSDVGVKLFKLEPDPAQPGSTPDFVLEVNLSSARVRSLLGAESGTATSGATSTRSKVVTRRNAAEHWATAKQLATGAAPFAMVNFAFFSTETTKTIAFPMKVDGRVVSYGYELTGGATGGGVWSGKYRYLAFDNTQNTATIATINHTSPSTLASADALTDSQATTAGREFLGGLTSDACIDCGVWRPRTFLATVDRTGDGRAELLIFSSERATNDYAVRILQHFKGTNVMQADGGKSSQLVVADPGNSTYIDDDLGTTITIVAGKILVRGEGGRARRVPHMLAIYPNTP